ncbi:MAG: SpoIIE family protein phosphatase [Gammaproteobacteria bacterium]|jgi:sigma-B regulation protein RsbU (phosphoserine phosphatase)|nr:SpoIIE family protein phosphatase [Xanthomonadales bacterium]
MSTDILLQNPSEESAGTLNQLKLLADLSQAFVESLNMDETLNIAVEKISDYMDAEAASVFLYNKDNKKLVCRASFGPVDIKGIDVDVHESIVGKALSSGQCQLIKDAKQDAMYNCNVDQLTGFETKSVLCTPLIVAGNSIGVLQVLNKQTEVYFDERDQDILRLLASPIALSINNARLTLSLVEQNRLLKEITLARRLQRSLLPARKKPPFPIVGTNVPAFEVSGDFYDYFSLGDDCVGFVVGDVSGKGLDASMLMVRASSLLRWIGKDRLSPSKWLRKANRELCENASRGMFVCAAAGYFYPKEDKVVWSNAGLPPAIHKCSETGIHTWKAEAPPLGIDADMEFPEQQTILGKGGLYFLTDGLTDARLENNQQLGIDGLIDYISTIQADSAEVRVGKIITFVRRQQLLDDATLLLIEKRDHLQEKFIDSISFEADPANLKMVRSKVSEIVVNLGFSKVTEQQLVLCIDEAVTNVYRHAYNNDCQGKVDLSFKLQNNTLVFYLRDYASLVYDNSVKPRDLTQTRPGGLGINIIDSVMDSWEFATPKDGYGNLLIMKKELDYCCS